MLRIVYVGMDLRILDTLRRCPHQLSGVYLPPAPYQFITRKPWFLSLIPRIFIKNRLQTAAVYAGVARYAKKYQLTILKARRINDPKFLRMIELHEINLGVVANFGQKLKQELISLPRHGFINCHPSLLPKYRGPAPVGHALLNKEKTIGVTWHQVSELFDQGDILVQQKFSVGPLEMESDLNTKASMAAADLLTPLLDQIQQGNLHPQAQDETIASYFPKLTSTDKQILTQWKRR